MNTIEVVEAGFFSGLIFTTTQASSSVHNCEDRLDIRLITFQSIAASKLALYWWCVLYTSQSS